MRKTAFLLAAISAFAPLPSPAMAAENSRGVAIVAGAEVGFGMCFEATEAKAYACARKKCEEAGAGDSAVQCEPARWCPVARYGGIVAVNNSEGFTYSEYLCDETDEPALQAAAKAICDKAFSEAAFACSFVTAWDPEGEALAVPEEPMLDPTSQ